MPAPEAWGRIIMDTWIIITLLVIGLALLIGSVLMRVLSSGKYEVKTIDLVFIVVPLLLVGLATGRLQGLDLFGVKADLSTLFADAANREIKDQVGQPPVSSVDDVTHFIEAPGKGGLGEIPRLIENKTEAISFRLGAGGYVPWMIKEYFEKLYGTSYLKFIVIENPDGTLFGVFTAADLIAYMRAAQDQGYQQFGDLINYGDDGARQMLARLPGFVSVDAAATTTTTKREALERMEQLDRSALPVVDADRRFVGTVERSKVIASLLLAVTTAADGK
jgi:CBS domain-containing protein